MDTDALTAGLLQGLRAVKPYPALSLTMPTHRRAPDNSQDAVRLRNLVAEAVRRLEADPAVTREARTALKEQLDRAVTEVDPRRALDALVLLVTADEHQIWQLPRTVPARVVLSDSYLTRNLVAAKAQAQPFWALTVSADRAVLWSGTADALREEPGGGFPLTAPQEPSDPQREERVGDTPSTFSDEETRNFLRTVDEKLRAVLAEDPRPLYLVGLAPRSLCWTRSGRAPSRPSAGSPRVCLPTCHRASCSRSCVRHSTNGSSGSPRRSTAGWTRPVAVVPSPAVWTRCGRPYGRAVPDWSRWRSTSSRRSG